MTISIKLSNDSYPASIGFLKPQDFENSCTRRWEQFLLKSQQSEYLRFLGKKKKNKQVNCTLEGESKATNVANGWSSQNVDFWLKRR